MLKRMLMTTLALTLLATAAAAVEPVSVLLNGHDEPITCWLRQMTESRYMLQGQNMGFEVFYEVPENQIITVDGKEEIPESALGTGRLIEYESFEVILPNGDVEVWSRSAVENKANVRTRVEFGAKTHELPRLKTMEAYDRFGNRLEHHITPRDDGLYSVVIELAVPVGFKEDIDITMKMIRPGAAVIQGDGLWSYTWNTDFPEDRIYTRKVQLPEGATFVSASHNTRPWDDVLPLTVYWRRYCPAATDDLMTITYRLP